MANHMLVTMALCFTALMSVYVSFLTYLAAIALHWALQLSPYYQQRD